ncbi:phage tail protein [Xenorhabdus stockiae]|uniref:phage tail protein n=1 Tax=Xenorhabdus stockiae TaxID=351614 RepID=UPI003CE819F9
MAKNEFLPFGLADGANVLTNEEYGKLIARTNGFSSGVAKSQELNKVWRQASVIATVVAQFIAETNNQDVLDDGNLATLQKGLLSALKATVSSNVPNASLTTAGITKLSNATDSNAENVAATSKAVRQIADAVASGLDEKQDKGDYATNAALNQVNDNANNRLEKAQNGADIPNTTAFVKNLGLAETKRLAENALLGIDQRWIDVTQQRKVGREYTNETGRPIMVNFTGLATLSESAAYNIIGYVDGVKAIFETGSMLTGSTRSISFIVPPGSTYSCSAYSHATSGFTSWVELR